MGLTSITIGDAVLADNPDIDLIICSDSTALPGQLQIAENKGLTKDDVKFIDIYP